MQELGWKLADTIALELVNRETDVNEVQKVAAHVRVHAEMHPEQVGQKFFTLLDTMVRDGRFLVRSGRTLDYYRDLREVCHQHLSNFRTIISAEKGWELAGILGWAARLMRYYNAEEGRKELASRERHFTEREQLQTGEKVRSPHQSQSLGLTSSSSPPASVPTLREKKPKAKPLPARVETVRETVTLLTAVKTGKARVLTTQGEEVTCTGLPAYPLALAGEVCRAEVTRENGQAMKSIFKGWLS
jgi:hypothetical protein